MRGDIVTLDDLKRFCISPDDPRLGLLRPWTRDGYTWASNGHIIVRVPVIADIPDNTQAPDGLALFNKQPPATEWIPVPTVEKPGIEDCDHCDGTGLHECDCDNEHTCGYCDGKGKCEAMTVSVPVGDTQFSDHYLFLIARWEIAPNGLKPAWIRKDDALGLLMPMRK